MTTEARQQSIEELAKKMGNEGYCYYGACLEYLQKAHAIGRLSGLQQAAEIAEYHHENHCENNDGSYRNCGMAIATGIRDLAKKIAEQENAK